MPRAVRRERRRQEHARQDPRRHPRARQRPDPPGWTAGRASPSPTEALAAGVGDGPSGARVLREPDRRREPLPRLAARARPGSSRGARCGAAPTEMLAPIGADDRRRPRGRRAHDRPAADAADRAARSAHGARVIVFDEPTSSLSQHEAERLYELIGRLRDARRHLHLRQPSPGGDLPAVRHVTVLRDGRHVATQPIADGRSRRARRDDDRPPARGVLSGARRAPTPGAELLRVERPVEPGAASRTCRSRVRAGEVRRAAPDSSAPADRKSRRRSSASIRAPRATSSSAASRVQRRSRRATRSRSASASCPRIASVRASCSR